MPSNLVPRGGRVGARVTVAGRQLWLGTYPDEDAALRAVQRARGGNLPAARTVAELAGRWDELDPRDRTVETSRHRQQMVAGFVRLHGPKLLESVSAQDCQLWATYSPGSVRYLRAMFGVAVRLELLERNLWERVVVAEGGRLRRRAFSLEEVERLAAAALEEWPGGYGREVADLYLITAGGGLRLSEAATVRICDCRNLARVSVEGKGSRRRTTMLLGFAHPAVKSSLMRAGRRTTWIPMPAEEFAQLKARLFRSEKGRPLSRGTVSKMHNRLLRRLGWTEAPTFHGLRHFYATTLMNHGASSEDVAIALGHFDELGRPDVRHVQNTYGQMDSGAALARLERLSMEGSDGADGPAGAGAAVG